MQLGKFFVRPVFKSEEAQFKIMMDTHHYLGFCPKIGETIWYVALFDNQWVALIAFSVSALKIKNRDDWIGWSHRHQFGRLKLITNNNRFLILPGFHMRNVATRIIQNS